MQDDEEKNVQSNGKKSKKDRSAPISGPGMGDYHTEDVNRGGVSHHLYQSSPILMIQDLGQ
jgi:hypothetical protein